MKEALRDKFFSTKAWFVETGPDLLVGMALLVLFYFIGSSVRRGLHKRALRKPEKGVILGFTGNVLMAVFILFGLFLFLNEMGMSRIITGLLAGAGFLSLIIGFAFKDIGENFLAGIILAFSRPFAIADLIEIEGTTGRVLQLNLRNTHLRTAEGRDVFIPNSLLVNRVLINYTRDGLMRHHFFIGIDNEEDIGRALQTALSSLDEIPQVLKGGEQKPYLLIDQFGESAIQLKVFYWTNLREIELSETVIKSRVMRKVYEAFRNAGISMPGNIVELKRYEPIQKDPEESSPKS